MKVSDRLRQIADELDGVTVVQVQMTVALKETGPEYPTFDAGVCSEDFWVKGRVGCQKGASQAKYSEGHMIISMLGGGGVPLHMWVLANLDPKMGAMESMRSAADIGWIDGSNYRPTHAAGQNFVDWVNAGCPTHNQYGNFDVRGELKTDNRAPGVPTEVTGGPEPQPGQGGSGEQPIPTE